MPKSDRQSGDSMARTLSRCQDPTPETAWWGSLQGDTKALVAEVSLVLILFRFWGRIHSTRLKRSSLIPRDEARNGVGTRICDSQCPTLMHSLSRREILAVDVC